MESTWVLPCYTKKLSISYCWVEMNGTGADMDGVWYCLPSSLLSRLCLFKMGDTVVVVVQLLYEFQIALTVVGGINAYLCTYMPASNDNNTL